MNNDGPRCYCCGEKLLSHFAIVFYKASDRGFFMLKEHVDRVLDTDSMVAIPVEVV